MKIWKHSLNGCLLLCLAAVQSVYAQTSVRYVHTDALGSVVAITDENRNVVERREYEPYGYQLTPAVQDGPGYTGHVQDAATGLVYMQQRYYDPGIGAMLSVDPVTAYEKPITNFCRYCYARNNPYKFTDPDGRQAYFMTPPALDREGGRMLAGTVADFTPVVGDIKGVVEAIQDPTPMNIVGAAAGLVPVVGDIGKLGLKHGDEAAQLGKKLASEQQMGELATGKGVVTHGAGTDQPLRQAERLAGDYGGSPGDYQKVSSSAYKAADGGHVETHAYRNAQTGQVVEPKTVIDPKQK